MEYVPVFKSSSPFTCHIDRETRGAEMFLRKCNVTEDLECFVHASHMLGIIGWFKGARAINCNARYHACVPVNEPYFGFGDATS